MKDNEVNLDAAYAVDDEMQREIDTLRADPWDLLPGKDGFTPVGLTEEPANQGDAKFDEGYRNQWIQTEIVEIENSGLRPLTARDNKDVIEGQIAFITMRSVRGPNEGKRIDQMWWLRNDDREAVRDMNEQLQRMFGKLNIQPPLVKLQDGRKAPSYVAGLEQLKGKHVGMVLQQKWAHPYTRLPNGEWEEQTDLPMKFKKRILDIKSV